MCAFVFCGFCSLISSSFFDSSPVNVIYRMKSGENETPQYALYAMQPNTLWFRSKWFSLFSVHFIYIFLFHWMTGWLKTEDWKFYEWNLVLHSVMRCSAHIMYVTFIDTFVEVNSTRLLRRYSTKICCQTKSLHIFSMKS